MEVALNVFMIVNPVAGRGKGALRSAEFARILGQRGHRVETFMSRKPGDPSVGARACPPDIDRMVVAGGDGTVSEVIDAAADPLRVPILHLASGTANMLSRDLGLPRDLRSLANVLEAGRVRVADIGSSGGSQFLMILSAGFDAEVVREISKTPRDILGYRGYASPILNTVLRYESESLAVSVDRGPIMRAAAVMLLKVRLYGGLFVFCNDASLDSGCFHVCLFEKGSKAALMKYAAAALTRTLPRLPDVKIVRGTHVSIESVHPVAVQIDGNPYGETPVIAELRKTGVPLVCP
ncbi:MAG: diacylglycerol kinase family protein [Pseudomonadota bacterium]